MLEQIKNLGVRIYIDDFGTGYSSLSYLNQFPFDAVKIDRSFVQQLKGSSGLLKSIIHMAHELNMSVNGEGIESLEQMKRLNEFGCECGQGYYFSKPVDSQTVEKMLDRYTGETCQPNINNGVILLGG
jgi:EAL domain-containing protein (putative c-di-GMP-specific phosphodiesterase class I)